MKTTKKSWSISRIIRTLDFFGESFTFRYQDEDKLSSILGGIICIIFYAIAIFFFVYNFIPFYRRENFSLQYYTMNSDNTEEIKLNKPPTAFAFGLDDGNKNELQNLLDINIKFKTVYKNNKANNKEFILETHQCTKEDFFNEHQKSFDDLNISKFKCLSKNDLFSPQGIYTDKIFSYYGISVVAKDKYNAELNNKIVICNHFLSNNF